MSVIDIAIVAVSIFAIIYFYFMFLIACRR